MRSRKGGDKHDTHLAASSLLLQDIPQSKIWTLIWTSLPNIPSNKPLHEIFLHLIFIDHCLSRPNSFYHNLRPCGTLAALVTTVPVYDTAFSTAAYKFLLFAISFDDIPAHRFIPIENSVSALARRMCAWLPVGRWARD